MTKKTNQTNKKGEDRHFFDVANLDKLSPEERKNVLRRIINVAEGNTEENERSRLTKTTS